MKRFIGVLLVLCFMAGSVWAADLQSTVSERISYPSYVKEIVLQEGEKFADDAGLVAFAQKTVPVGKVAEVQVIIRVRKIRDAE